MRHPRTLLDIAGVAPAPFDPARATLVLIDVQQEYVLGALPLAGVDRALEEIATLLAFARRHAVPVVHVVHHAQPGSALFDPSGPFTAIATAATPRPGEAIVVKTWPNSFAGTDLDRLLRDSGRTDLILAGFMTHMCVGATARAALDLGYRSIVVAGATATRDLPGASGGVVPAEQVQAATLAALGDRFATVVEDVSGLA